MPKDLSQFQWKSAHAPKKELPKDFCSQIRQKSHNRDFAFFCVRTNETSASRNLRSYLVLQRLCNEAALSPGIDAFLY